MKKNSRLIALLAACCFILGCSQFSILGMLDSMADSTGLSVALIGQLTTVHSYSNALGTPLTLVATARMSRRGQLVLSLALMALGLAITATTSSFALLLLSRVFTGVGHGVFVAISYSIVYRLAEPGKETSAMSAITLAFSASMVLAIPLSHFAVNYVDWHLIFGGLTAFAVLATVALYRAFASSMPAEQLSLKERFAPLRNPRLATAMLVTFVMYAGYNALYNYITPFVQAAFPEQGQLVSVLLLVIGAMSIVGSKGSGLIADAKGAPATLIGCLSLLSATFLLLVFFGNSGFLTVAILCVWTISAWSFIPSQNAVVARLAPKSTDVMLGISTSFLQFGYATGAAIGGAVFHEVSLSAIPAISFVLVATALVLEAFVVLRVTNRRNSRSV